MPCPRELYQDHHSSIHITDLDITIQIIVSRAAVYMQLRYLANSKGTTTDFRKGPNEEMNTGVDAI